MKLLSCTSEIVDKKSIKFLKLVIDTIIPKLNDFSGVKFSRDGKIEREWAALTFSFGRDKVQTHKDRNKVPKIIYKIGKIIFEFSCTVFILLNPKTTTITPIIAYEMVYHNIDPIQLRQLLPDGSNKITIVIDPNEAKPDKAKSSDLVIYYLQY